MWIAPSASSMPLQAQAMQFVQFKVFPGTPLEAALKGPKEDGPPPLLPFRRPFAADGCTLNRFAHWELAGTSLDRTFSDPHSLSSDSFLRIGGVTLAVGSTTLRSPVDLLILGGTSSLPPAPLMTLDEADLRENGVYAEVKLDPSVDTLTLETRRLETGDLVQSRSVRWNKKGRVDAVLETGRDENIDRAARLIAQATGSEHASLRAAMACNGVLPHVAHFIGAREIHPHLPIAVERGMLGEASARLQKDLFPEIARQVLEDEAVLFHTVLKWWGMVPPPRPGGE